MCLSVMPFTGLEWCTSRESKFKILGIHLVGENSVNEWTNRWGPIYQFNYVTVGQF